MPELPEIFNLAVQMNMELAGKRIAGAEIRQKKCLNVSEDEFTKLIKGKIIDNVTSKGKWIFTKLEEDTYFLLNLGMGGNVLYHKPGEPLPDKYRLKFDFDDGSMLSINFWWFGYAHAVVQDGLKHHMMTSSLGISPVGDPRYTYENFCRILKGKKGAVKHLLMNQEYIAGIGNVYIQDILYRAGLHPDRKIPGISETERRNLFKIIGENLEEAVKLGGYAFEKDLYDRSGRFDDFLVGYREGKPCPGCGTFVKKIKTGSTASYICPKCQK